MRLFRMIVMIILVAVSLSACTSPPSEHDTTSIGFVSTVMPSEATEDATVDTPETRGQHLFTRMIDEVGFSCASCHHLSDARLIGPGMSNIEERRESYDVEERLDIYIFNSIRYPQDYIADGDPAYPDNVMPSYDGILSDDEINDLVAYIMSL